MSLSAEEILHLFKSLVDSFLSGEIPAPEFEKRYTSLWRNYRDSDENLEINVRTNQALDRLFVSLDCYCSEVDLRDENDLDDEQLFQEVKEIARDL